MTRHEAECLLHHILFVHARNSVMLTVQPCKDSQEVVHIIKIFTVVEACACAPA